MLSIFSEQDQLVESDYLLILKTLLVVNETVAMHNSTQLIFFLNVYTLSLHGLSLKHQLCVLYFKITWLKSETPTMCAIL